MKQRKSALLGIAVGIWIFFTAAWTFGQLPVQTNALYEEHEFRVNNKVTAHDSGEILSDGKTIFSHGNVYDFLEIAGTISVYNPQKGVFYLLDTNRKEKLIVTQKEVDTYVESLRQWGITHENSNVRVFFVPDFKVQYNSESRQYTFASELLTYFVTPVSPERAPMLEMYRQFARNSCKFNIMLSPGSKTLFARMQLNETIFNAGMLINKLQLSIREPRGMGLYSKPQVFLSEYQYLPRLVESDRVAVRNADECIANFKEITFAQFRKRQME